MRLESLIVCLGMLLSCAPAQVIAEVGQKPFPKTEGGSGNDARPDTTQKSSTKNVNTPSSSAASPPSSSPATPNPSVNTPSEKLIKRVGTAHLVEVFREAEALAQKHQADVDRKRQGKPKRHVVGAEASNCLTPQTGGGVVNSCPFAVEYSYCVFHPTKDSWSASFDCEKTKGGSWQIEKGPNSRSIMHTDGETTYWFACKYGPTLHQPDGISPADIEFQRGRGLLGRCAEWGDGKLMQTGLREPYQTTIAPQSWRVAPQSSAVAPDGINLNGEWIGKNSGNRVRHEVRPGGILVTPVTQNVGQAADGFFFSGSGKTYRFKFTGGDTVMEVLGPDKIRVTNSDGWTDVFTRPR
jgi:hypothetical protein